MPNLSLRLILFVLVGLSVASTSFAGPWARDKGGVFTSLSAERERAGGYYAGLYSEYGWGDRTTLGLELGRTEDESSALFWWQRTLDNGVGANRVALSFGLGMIRRGDDPYPIGQMGVSWGRGWDDLPVLGGIPGGGWLAVESRFKLAGIETEFALEPGSNENSVTYLTPEASAKLDVTLGWHAGERLMLINQIRLEDRKDAGFSARWAVSAVHEIAGPIRVEIGAVLPLTGSGEQALKLGTWLEF